MRIILFLIIPFLVYAKSYIISPLPFPSEKVLDIDDKNCNESCLKKLYTQGLYFSFIAKFNPNITDKKLLEFFADALTQINSTAVLEQDSAQFRVALILPKQLVGRYSVVISNTILAYLMSRNIDFNFEVFDSINEETLSLETAYNEAIKNNFNFIIAILTQEGTQNLISQVNILYPTYIPTINKERISGTIPKNLYFGGISYKKQFDMLTSMIKNSNVVEYIDDSQIGSYLTRLFATYNPNIIHNLTINNQEASQFTKTLKSEERFLQNATIVLNTSASRSGLILSTLGYSERQPKQILSTQINFNPTFLRLTSPKDRQQFYIVNAIGKTDANFVEYAALLGSDLLYDWVNYATSIGVEFGLGLQNQRLDRFFSESLQSNQVEYQDKIYTTKDMSFVPVNR